LKGAATKPAFFYVGHHGGGGILTGVKMHGHLETIGGEPSSCGGPDSARAADHERGAGRAGRGRGWLGALALHHPHLCRAGGNFLAVLVEDVSA